MTYSLGARRASRLMLLAALCVGLLGCQADEDRAQDIAHAWFSGLTDAGSEDRGWSVLHPRVQAAFEGGQSEYLDLVADSDLESFEWSLVGRTTGRDGFHVVHIQFNGGRQSVPDFLVERLLIQLSQGLPADQGIVIVHFGGGAGIYTPYAGPDAAASEL